MTSRLLGLVRDQVLAFLFGAGNAMDAFNVAFRLLNLARDLFAEGAMSAAFVPTFTRHLTQQGKAAAWRLGNHVINALVVVTGVLVVLGMLLAGPLATLFAEDYSQVPGKLELTIALTRVMFPFLTLVALAAVCMGMLNALHRFFIPALSPAMFNIATIICALALVPVLTRFGIDPIFAVAIGALVGGLGQVAVQWPPLAREGFRYEAALDPRDPGLREILVLMGPGIMGLAAVQINILVNTVLATGQGTGAVSWLNYAFRLMYMPIGLFGVSIATAAIPSISCHAVRDELSGMQDTISHGLRLMMMLNVPATAGLMALSTPIIALIFEHGRFTSVDTQATAGALMFYAPGLVGYSAVKIAVPSFYALRDSRTPVAVSVATVAINVVLNLVLVRILGYRGLALGTAVSALFNAVVLLWLLRRRLNGLDERNIVVAFVKIAAASLVMAVAAWVVERSLSLTFSNPSILVRALTLGTAIAIGLGVLIAMGRVLRIRELNEAVALVVNRFSRAMGR
jgi:putative peptidoglycan lipid II flippase